MKIIDSWKRPWGRFFCALAISALCGTVAHGAGSLTPISDIVYRADGTPARGTVVITWPAFSTADNRAIAAGSLSVAIANGGQLSVGLVPNSGGTPAGTYYKVVYKLDDGSTSEEYWSVPSATTTTISAIRSKIVPSSVAMQVVSRQYVDSSLAAKADNTAVVHNSGDETISGTKQFTQSPQLPAPTGDNSAATKLYVDSAMSARGVTSFNGRTGAVTPQSSDYTFSQLSGLPASFPPSAHSHSAADLASGVLNTNRVVSGTVAGSRCLQTSADGMQISETAGACGGTSSNATQIQGRNICPDAPSDGNAVTWDAASSCYKPKPGASSNADMVDGVHAAGFAQMTADAPAAGQVPAYDSANGKYKPQSKGFVDARDYTTWANVFAAAAAMAPPASVLIPSTPYSQTGPYNGSNTANVPVLSYNTFATGAGGTGPYPTVGHNVRKRYIQEWGYCSNDEATDTAILNQALAAMSYFSLQSGAGANSNGNQTLVIDGGHYDRGCRFNNPTWPTANGKNFWLTIEINGRMDIAQAWDVPHNIAIVGMNEKVSGSPGTFQAKPNSFIQCWNTTGYCINFEGNQDGGGHNYIANLNIVGNGFSAGALAATNGGSGVWVSNIAASCPNSSTNCVPFTLDNWLWANIDHFTFSQGAGATKNYSVRLDNSQNLGNGTAIVSFSNGVFVGGGTYLTSNDNAINSLDTYAFEHTVVESAAGGAYLTIDGNSAVTMGGIEIYDLQVADSSMGCGLQVNGVSGTGVNTVQNIHVRNVRNGFPVCAPGGQQIFGFNEEDELFTSGVNRPTPALGMKHYSYRNNGIEDVENNLIQGTYPMAVPHAAMNVPQDAGSWASAGGVTITPGQADPWGGTNAAKISSSTVPLNWTLYDPGAMSLNAGDWFVYGLCLRPDPASGHATGLAPLRWYDSNGVAVWDDFSSLHFTQFTPQLETSNQVASGWECIAHAAKVTTGGAAHPLLQFTVTLNYPFWASMPWSMYIPAASAPSDREVIRWARTLRAVPSNAVAGQVYMPGGIAVAGTTPVCRVAADGTADDTATLASCMTAGKHVRLPAGTIVIRPDILNLADDLTLEGAGRGATVLKVKDGVGSYATIIGPAAGSVNNASVRHLTIDQNETGNPTPSRTDIEAHPRLAIHVDGGDKLSIDDVEFRDVKSINTVLSQAAHTSITNSHFILNGSGNVYHDHSSIYIHADDVNITNNFFTGVVNGAGTVSAIETHSSSQVVAGNNINGYRVGMNITGISAAESKAITVTGNTLLNVMQGIEFYSHSYGTHTSGYGLDGALVADNAIYVAQNDWTTDSQSGTATVGNAFGIGLGACDLAMRNLSIRDNVVFYDLDAAGHPSTSASAGILLTNSGVANCTIDTLDISGNQIANAPASGIYIGLNGSNFDISGNHITNPGSATDTNLNAGYRNGIDIGNPGAVTGTVRLANNYILDNLATTRMVRGIYLASGVATSFEVRGALVSVTGSTTTAYLAPIEDARPNTDTIYAEILQTAPALTTGRLPLAKLVPGSRIVDGSSGKWWAPISTGIMVEGAFSSPNSQFKIYGNPILFSPNNTDRWMFTWDGQFAAFTDNVNDIGTASANRPRTVYAGTSVIAPVVKATGAGSGIVVKSPDGNTCKTIGIDNSGAITATAATCP